MRQTNLIDVYQPFISHKTLIGVLVEAFRIRTNKFQ